MCLPQVSHGHVTNWRACRFYTEPVHLSEKRFKKEAGFLPNAPKKKFGLRIARYFNRFPIFPLPAREVRWYKNTGSYPWYWNLGRPKLALWYNDVQKTNFKEFKTVAETIQTHYSNILNFFNNRSTNASAESLNSKIKAFRMQLRGVSDVKYFLFRLAKIYA